MAKHRSGSVDTIKMRFKGRLARFENWSEADIDPDAVPVTVESSLNSFGQAPTGTFTAPASLLSGGTADFLAGPSDAPAPF